MRQPAGVFAFARAARAALLAAAVMGTIALSGCAHIVLLHDPLTASEHNDLGVAYESAGQPALAVKEYRKSVRLEPRQSEAWVNLGNVEAAAERWPSAEKLYRRALREVPTDADAMNNLAIALIRQGRNPAEARALAERAVAAGGDRDSLYRATLAEVAGAARE